MPRHTSAGCRSATAASAAPQQLPRWRRTPPWSASAVWGPSEMSEASAAEAAGRFGGAMTTMIRNRARQQAGAPTAAGTLYWAVGDADVRGLSSAATLQRLSPAAVAADGVRRVEVL